MKKLPIKKAIKTKFLPVYFALGIGVESPSIINQCTKRDEREETPNLIDTNNNGRLATKARLGGPEIMLGNNLYFGPPSNAQKQPTQFLEA